MANAMHSAGDKEGALKLLKEYNVEGVNNAEIGTILSKEKKPARRPSPISPGFAERGNRHASVQRGYANACLHLNRPAQSLEFNQLLYQFTQGLKEPGKMSYLDKVQVILLLLNAFACSQLGDREQTKEYLRQARQLALRFDAAPSYGLEHHKFITYSGTPPPTTISAPPPWRRGSPAEGQRKRLPRPVGPVEEVCHEEA